MADMTFNCPHCQQPIQCDDQWSGQQIQCPLCQGALLVPQAAPSAPAPAGSPGQSSLGKQLVEVPGSTKLSFQHNAQKPAAPERNIPIRNLAQPAPKKKSPVGKILTWTVVLVGLGVGAYFGWSKWQERAKVKSGEQAKNSQGTAGSSGQGEGATSGATNAAAAPATPAIPPPVPPDYTLDVSAAKVPEGAVNGMIAGSNFVAELTRIDPVGPAQVLRLTQGTPPVPERELLIYLHLKPGEKLSGQSWTISTDMRGPEVPQVYKRWKVREGYAPAMKAYASGYAMKLEFGQLANGSIPGKIYIALPDTEKTVAGGVFNATTSVPDVISAAPVAGAPAASAPAVAPADASAFQRRYGRPPGR